MSHLAVNTASNTKFALLLEFIWGPAGDEEITRYTSYDQGLTIAGDTWSSQVRMEVIAGEQDGSAGDKSWTVKLPPIAPLDAMVLPYPHAVVTCNIYSTDPTVLDGSQKQLEWSGKIIKTTSAPSNVAGIVEAEVGGWKSDIQYGVGVEARDRCSNIHGASPCCFDLTPHRQTATVTDVSGMTLTAPTITTPSGYTNWWEAGSVNVGGLNIKIRGVTAGVFRMSRPVPPGWLGAAAVFTPGCLKRVPDCDERDNISNYMGIGIGIPAYNPETDDPG